MKTFMCRRMPNAQVQLCGYKEDVVCFDGRECDATRYVRADVAMRYARMRESIAYRIGHTEGLNDCGVLADRQLSIDDAIHIAKQDEVQQAAQRGKDEQ